MISSWFGGRNAKPPLRQAANVGRYTKKPYNMKSKLILALLSLFLSISLFSQNIVPLKRTPYTLKVIVDKKHVYEEEIAATEYVKPNNTVQLYPGELIYLEIEVENGLIKSVSAVDSMLHPEKTLIIKFTQTVKKKEHEMVVLSISNPFSRDLIYKSKIFLLKQNRWTDTNVLPVMAGLSAFETWPDIITSIALGQWEFKTK
jgi:hypothetical protein